MRRSYKIALGIGLAAVITAVIVTVVVVVLKRQQQQHTNPVLPPDNTPGTVQLGQPTFPGNSMTVPMSVSNVLPNGVGDVQMLISCTDVNFQASMSQADDPSKPADQQVFEWPDASFLIDWLTKGYNVQAQAQHGVWINPTTRVWGPWSNTVTITITQ